MFFYDWEYYRNHLSEILLPFRFSPNFEFTGFQGLASHGAAIAIIIAMYYFSKKIMKRPLLWVLDRVVIPVASGAIFVRIGNFFNSEIVGTETTSAFGIRFVRDQFSGRDAMTQWAARRLHHADADERAWLQTVIGALAADRHR